MAETHYFANDGSNWTTPPSPVDSKEARAADKRVDTKAAKGDGPTATNETQLHRTIVEGSESPNGHPAEGEGANGA